MSAKSQKTHAIDDDLQRLQRHDFDRLPAMTLYSQVLTKMFALYTFIVGIPFLVLMAHMPLPQITPHFCYEDWLVLSLSFQVVSLFFLPKIVAYITFRKTIKPHLKLGALIDVRFKQMFGVFIFTYSFWVVLATDLFFPFDFQHWGKRMIMVLIGLDLGTMITALFFKMALTRTGIATLLEQILAFKKTNRAQQSPFH